MTRKIIRIGTSPNDGTGDTLRETANKINYNFAELYNAFGIDGCGGDINIHLQPPCGNDLILSTCGDGKVIIGDPDNPIITVPSPTGPIDDFIIKPPPTKHVVIGDDTCGSVVKIPACNTEEPIVIGDPNPTNPTKPTITVPTDPTEPIVIHPGPDPDGKVIIGDPTPPVNPTDPTHPKITVPSDPTKPITIDPGDPGGGGGGGGGGGDGGGGVKIGDPEHPTITIPPNKSTDKAQVGSTDKPVDVVINSTGQGPWEVVFTNAEKKLDSDVYIQVQEPKDEIHSIEGYGEVGRNKQFAATNLILEPHLDEPDPIHPNSPLPGTAGIYFTRPETDLTKFGEAQNLTALNPTRRAAYIKYISNNGGDEYSGVLRISPWYQPATAFNTNLIDYDFATDNQGIFITRYEDFMTQPASTGPNPPNDNNEPNEQHPIRTTQTGIGGLEGHQTLNVFGSMDFAPLPALGGQYTSNHPQFAAGANRGYSYIIIPALHTASGAKWIGQISSNPKRIRKDEDNGVTPWAERDGIPFWSLGYKMSTQLIENFPSGGIAQYERIPDNHAISWDVRGRVSINEAALDETLNILGSLKIQVASTTNNPNGVVNANYRTGRKQTGQENEVGIYFADGTFQYTAWQGAGAGKSFNIVGTANEVEVTGPTNGVYTVGLPDDVTITGNLTVNGTTTTINSTTLTVDDKNIEIGSVTTPTDDTANGGGITLKGATDKTIIWDKLKNRWVFNKGVDVVDAVVNNLEANKFVKSDANKKLITSKITWSDLESPDCGTPITIGHDCNPGDGIKIPAGNDGTSPVEVGNGGNPVKIGGGGDSGGTGITVPKNGSGDPIKIGSPIKFPDNTTQSSAAKTYSHSAETTTGGAFIRLKGTATGATDTTDDVKLANGTNVTITRTDADTITIAANNTTYSHSAEASTGGALIRLTGSDSTNDDIKLAAGSNMTITRTDADTITFASSYVDTNTTYSHSAETTTGGAMIRLTGSDSTNDDVKLIAGSNMTVTRTDADTITLTANVPVDTFFDKGTGGGALTFDRNQGTIQKIVLTSNVTGVTISNMSVAQSFTIIFVQDGTGGRTLTTSGSFKFAAGYKNLSNLANSIDMLNIFYDGTTYYCTLTTGYA